MKRIGSWAVWSLTFLAVIGLSAFQNSKTESSKAQRVELDPANCTVSWTGKKVTGKHTGTIEIKEGYLNHINGVVTGGEFVINMNSIVNTDIKDEEYRNKLVNHLKSEDFFNVEEFPTAKFVIKGVQPTFSEGGNSVITGDLTIKGVTHEIEFVGNIDGLGEVIKAVSTFTIDRSKWNVRYKSKSFFPDLGDKFIYDDIEFQVNIMANK